MDLLLLKKQVHEIGVTIIDSRIASLHTEMKNFQSAANNETKSSAGDKYETGRAMMQLEKEKVASLIGQLQKQQKVLGEINPLINQKNIGLGSIVNTDSGYFFISISLGKIETDHSVICISPVSPLGNAMIGKLAGEQVVFNGKKYQIQEVC